MKIAIASVMQESNSFAPRASVLPDFQFHQGKEMIRAFRGTNTEVGGFVEELERLGFEAVPLASAWALANGPVEDAVFDRICELLLEQISPEQFDGLLIALHGAWLSESHPSADAEVIRRIRAKVGERVPIVATLDLHANVRPELLKALWGAVGYRTYPHVDMAEAGSKAARMMQHILKRGRPLQFYWLPFPFIAPPQVATTDRGPIHDMLASLDSQLQDSGISSASFFCVQPWLDVPQVTSSFVIAADSRSAPVAAIVGRAAEELWNRRAEFAVEWVPPHALMEKAAQFPPGPVVISEGYDATTGGAPGDHPGLLRTLLPHAHEVSGCVYVVDPQAAETAAGVGEGGRFAGNVGAGFDKRFGAPVAVSGTVRHLSAGQFTLRGPAFTGKQIDMGPTAVIQAGNLDIVVASHAVMMIDPELYRSQGIEPRERRLVGVKSPTLFRPAYKEMLVGVLHLDMPGVCRGNLRQVPFQQIARPIFPLDDFSWQRSLEGVWV